MKRLNIIILTVVIALLGFVSCDFTSSLEEDPDHIMTGNSLFQDRSGFESALNGLYGELRFEYQKQIMLPNRVTTDALVCNSCFWGYNLMLKEMGDRVVPSNSNVAHVWNKYYEIINAANNIIAQAESEDVNISEEEKNLFLAEAKAARAFVYRHLTYYWGDVPMPLEPSSGESIRTDWERTPVSDVRDQMVEDFSFAQEHIPVEATRPGRMTKGAVQHWLAETYLAMGEDELALDWANEVIDEPAYQLITERFGAGADQPGSAFMDIFHPENADRENGNTESLWVHQFARGASGGGQDISPRPRYTTSSVYEQITVNGVNPFHITPDRGGRGTFRQSMTKWTLDLYEDGDERASDHAIRYFLVLKDAEANAPHPADNLPEGWAYGDTLWLDYSEPITPATEDRFDWPFTKKFDWAIDANPAIRENFHNLIYLRLAETYLLKAEAQLKTQDPQGAANTINIVRDRSNASLISAGDVDIDFILDERARELIHEEQRRHQLVRTGKWYERTTAHNPSAAARVLERNKLFPIPQAVIDANKTEIAQNPGY